MIKSPKLIKSSYQYIKYRLNKYCYRLTKVKWFKRGLLGMLEHVLYVVRLTYEIQV